MSDFAALCERVARDMSSHQQHLARFEQREAQHAAQVDDLGDRIADLRIQQDIWDAEYEESTIVPGTGLTIAEINAGKRLIPERPAGELGMIGGTVLILALVALLPFIAAMVR